MLTLIALIVAILFLPAIWGWLAVGVALAIDIIELVVWMRWRGKKSIAGHNALVGLTAEVQTVCRPEGRVSIQGQLWKAYCAEGAEPGDAVIVQSVDGLVLTVTPQGSSKEATLA